MATVMDLKFDTIAKAQDWWSMLSTGAGGVPAPVAFVADGANSRVEIDLAARGTAIPAVAAAFSVKSAAPYGGEFPADAVMDSNLGFAAGTLVNCFDPNPAIRGRYVKVGAPGSGSWSRQGEVVDKAWPDPNHAERLLELLLCSWIDTTPGHPGAGNQRGWVSPPNRDWSNAKITYDMRIKGGMLGKWGKLVQHVQGDIADLTALLPAGSYATPNFIFVKDVISDQLGFGNDGWGRPNKVEYVHDSGRRPVVLNYSPLDADWRCLGSVTRPMSYYHYVVVPIARLLTNLIGNSYLMAVHDKPQPDGAAFLPVEGGIPEKDRIAGKLMIYGIKVEVP